MRKALLTQFGITLMLLSTFLTSGTASASWYVGNTRNNAYGAWAYITTPSTAPSLVSGSGSGEYNHVTTYGPNWIQTGWGFFYGQSAAFKYVESCINQCNQSGDYYMNDQIGTQGWGTTVDYLIEWQYGTHWCAYVGGVQKHCRDVRSAPTTAIAESEVQYSSDNGLDTTFNPVRYKQSNGVWTTFDGNNFWADSPYHYQAYSSSSWRAYR